MAALTLDVERPAAGGRMIARHDGRVVLVAGAIPGERVVAQIESARKGVVFAQVSEVLTASPDRRPIPGDPGCGGGVLAHVAYDRQLRIKGEIVEDAFKRIGRISLPAVPAVVASPERGYRMRARFHVSNGRIGFYREGTHQLCDARATGQLLEASCDWLSGAERAIGDAGPSGVVSVEMSEDVAGDRRACHLECAAGVDPTRYRGLFDGLVGLSARRGDRGESVPLGGSTVIHDRVRVRDDPSAPVVSFQHDVRAFFQGNRYLLEALVWRVVAGVPQGPVLDLYAGGGLFGLSVAAATGEGVTLVEGDAVSGADLERNASAFGTQVRLERRSVEAFMAGRADGGVMGAVIVDPPRTGLSRPVVDGLIRMEPSRILYVSCDVATLARDARALVDAGYRLGGLEVLDLFPNTAHVEAIARFDRSG